MAETSIYQGHYRLETFVNEILLHRHLISKGSVADSPFLPSSMNPTQSGIGTFVGSLLANPDPVSGLGPMGSASKHLQYESIGGNERWASASLAWLHALELRTSPALLHAGTRQQKKVGSGLDSSQSFC